jgi:hypothetical protein
MFTPEVYKCYIRFIYKVVQIWPGQTVTCLHTNSPCHIWTTLYIDRSINRRIVYSSILGAFANTTAKSDRTFNFLPSVCLRLSVFCLYGYEYPCSVCVSTSVCVLSVCLRVSVFCLCVYEYPCSVCVSTSIRVLSVCLRVSVFCLCVYEYLCSVCVSTSICVLSVCLRVFVFCLHGKTWLALDMLSWKFVLRVFTSFCWLHLNLVKIG